LTHRGDGVDLDCDDDDDRRLQVTGRGNVVVTAHSDKTGDWQLFLIRTDAEGAPADRAYLRCAPALPTPRGPRRRRN